MNFSPPAPLLAQELTPRPPLFKKRGGENGAIYNFFDSDRVFFLKNRINTYT